ncbi:MAG TPA: hypothetical protein VKB09_13295 [Thermomicrobiales bacterium]|nr:hypothetical protein [Thermomicrobiales bacterium]
MIDEQVNSDFDRARQKALFRELLSIVRREPNELIPYYEVRRRVAPEVESYRGIQPVPVRQIVGSVDRFRDFDRAFLPRQRHTAGRWKNIDRAYHQDVRLPPVQLYKVGDVYFVKDGNHRVSVARERGVEFIDAEVFEGHIRVPLYASMSPAELLLQVEYAEFLRHTDLDRLRPDHDIRPTALGRYDEILDHILLHQEWLNEHCDHPASIQEAVTSWYDDIYQPIVQVLREQGITKRFANRSDADIYLWVMAHRDELEHRYGHEVDPAESASDYAQTVKRDARLTRRLSRVTRGATRRVARVMHLPNGSEEHS